MASALTAPVDLGSAATSTNSTTFVLNTTADVTPGYGIAVFIATTSTSAVISSVTDAAGNTYVATANSPITGTRRGWVYVCPSASKVLVASSAITVTFSASQTAKVVRAVRLYSVALSGAADTAPAGSSGTSTAPTSGATGTLAQADELELGLIVTDGVVADTFTIGGGFTLAGGSAFNTAASNIGLYPAYKIVSATTGDTYSATITSRGWAAVVSSYRAAAFPDTQRLAAIDTEADLSGGARGIAGLAVEIDQGPVYTSTVTASQSQSAAVSATYIPATGGTTYPITRLLTQAQSVNQTFTVFTAGSIPPPTPIATYLDWPKLVITSTSSPPPVGTATRLS